MSAADVIAALQSQLNAANAAYAKLNVNAPQVCAFQEDAPQCPWVRVSSNGSAYEAIPASNAQAMSVAKQFEAVTYAASAAVSDPTLTESSTDVTSSVATLSALASARKTLSTSPSPVIYPGNFSAAYNGILFTLTPVFQWGQQLAYVWQAANQAVSLAVQALGAQPPPPPPPPPGSIQALASALIAAGSSICSGSYVTQILAFQGAYNAAGGSVPQTGQYDGPTAAALAAYGSAPSPCALGRTGKGGRGGQEHGSGGPATYGGHVIGGSGGGLTLTGPPGNSTVTIMSRGAPMTFMGEPPPLRARESTIVRYMGTPMAPAPLPESGSDWQELDAADASPPATALAERLLGWLPSYHYVDAFIHEDLELYRFYCYETPYGPTIAALRFVGAGGMGQPYMGATGAESQSTDAAAQAVAAAATNGCVPAGAPSILAFQTTWNNDPNWDPTVAPFNAVSGQLPTSGVLDASTLAALAAVGVVTSACVNQGGGGGTPTYSATVIAAGKALLAQLQSGGCTGCGVAGSPLSSLTLAFKNAILTSPGCTSVGCATVVPGVTVNMSTTQAAQAYGPGTQQALQSVVGGSVPAACTDANGVCLGGTPPPPPTCGAGQVLDTVTGQCVNACPDGSAPANGVCGGGAPPPPPPPSTGSSSGGGGAAVVLAVVAALGLGIWGVSASGHHG